MPFRTCELLIVNDVVFQNTQINMWQWCLTNQIQRLKKFIQ